VPTSRRRAVVPHRLPGVYAPGSVGKSPEGRRLVDRVIPRMDPTHRPHLGSLVWRGAVTVSRASLLRHRRRVGGCPRSAPRHAPSSWTRVHTRVVGQTGSGVSSGPRRDTVAARPLAFEGRRAPCAPSADCRPPPAATSPTGAFLAVAPPTPRWRSSIGLPQRLVRADRCQSDMRVEDSDAEAVHRGYEQRAPAQPTRLLVRPVFPEATGILTRADSNGRASCRPA
jgi:hypothetical protein